MSLRKISGSRHRGAALLIIVLIGFILLFIISGIAISIAWETMRVEGWQTQNIERRRLDYIARTAANLVVEEISSDKGVTSFDNSLKISDGISADKKLIFDDPQKTYLTLSIKGSSSYCTITSVVSADNGEKVTVSANMIKSGDTYITTWRNGK